MTLVCRLGSRVWPYDLGVGSEASGGTPDKNQMTNLNFSLAWTLPRTVLAYLRHPVTEVNSDQGLEPWGVA